ncbi:BREX system P-loop protein BrxC [Actimicrobium sp. CCI2.3]|uniref:BREX system P-loop protein BrxC n=1 Tax=Actimicrobium sp. CCI2.3 TaxID=3048616 RepID=UPI002AB48293|nr:BREX system P-loop protein BrxC [Actimicrobium sp. CCI2.3]MDY7573079.1 BREX system P-loop protein BrxC [Actimicrobium sp. CCI2.3]MEB0020876.1 BREX system P-loop protein BrxC [Actimicrobium sp. CCI2.3]
MNISELFLKPINRPINGVIKADQMDAASVWQELEEYVVTKQISEYLRKFFDAYLAAIDSPNDAVVTDRMGVWVSGFFGSGKSHFIKILSYLLENIEAHNPQNGEKRHAAQFFDHQKIKDAMLLADIQRAVQGTADVILFNIDAKADSKTDRDAILQVFLRVFNEKLGYSGDAPHIADMERHLVAKGAFDAFKLAFAASNGSTWEKERDAVDFLRDDVVAALAPALKMTPESAGLWFDKARDDYRINIESFAKVVKDYLATRPANHKVIFLVDEVGQFIGANSQLMLSLQTITEQLGTQCKGRAWVIVTSQADIDAAIGDANLAKSQDFSKIQGRFHTRLSLASSNTDEVISERLLTKTEPAHVLLRDAFASKSDVINNQLSFVGNSVSLRGYKDAAEFVATYPFAPYQFTLLQKIFESIRKVGATGKHLSQGERSLLDAFQAAAVSNASKGMDVLVPLYDFYSSIESFIDGAAKRSIDQAPENPGLQAYDSQLLKAMFLIRYIPDIVKPTIDNLATLCIDQIDADKLALKRKIQESLARLEQQRLVSRNGDLWFFLTNEERDVAREIGHVDVSASEKSRVLAELIYDDILSAQTKVRHRDTKADYEFNRLLDGAPWRQANNALNFELLTPLGDEYERLQPARCILRSSEGNGRAIIRLDEGERLDIELALYLQIEKYIVSPKADQATPSLKRILADRKDENRERRTRLMHQLSELISAGDFYALGQPVQIKSASPEKVLDELLNYLITNTYSKLPYLKIRQPDPIAEIKAVLASDDLGQHALGLNGEAGNALAIKEMRDYLQLAASQKKVMLSDVVERFAGIPWGWKPEWETVLLIARLFMAGEIKLMFEGSDLDPNSAADPLTKSARFKQVSILKRKTADATAIKRARDLYKDLFQKMGREEEDGLVADFRARMTEWQADLKSYVLTAATPHHPGKSDIDSALTRIAQKLSTRDSFAFIEALLTTKDEWLDVADDIHDLVNFYKTQITAWRKLLDGLSAFADNREALNKVPQAAAALVELAKIRDNPKPYSQVNRIEPLIASVTTINEQLAQEKRERALISIDNKLAEVQVKLGTVAATADLSNQAMRALQDLKIRIASQTSIAQIMLLQAAGADAMDDSIDLIEALVSKIPQPVVVPTDGTKPLPTIQPNAPTPAPKTTQVIRAADLSSKTYLETEADVDAFLSKLKQALLAAVRAGQIARIQ